MPTLLRPELGVLPLRIAKLPIDRRGYPVPWFVAWVDGEPEFRAMDRTKWTRAVNWKLCWVCGEALGVHLTFLIGPMCALNRTIAEPPSHHECAVWSAQHCPFLSRPHMVRREDEVYNKETLVGRAPGFAIPRNPGVACIWTTRSYKVFRAYAGADGYLLEIGEPERVEWFAQGRAATRAEVEASIDSGLPLLREACFKGPAESHQSALAELAKRLGVVTTLLPPS